jgi:hypothetical protein
MRKLLVLALSTLLAAPAGAYDLVNDEALRARVITWARAGWQLQLDDQSNVSQGPYVDLARIFLDAEFKGVGRGFVNVAGKSGTFVLLDVFGEVELGEHVAVRVGRDRTNTSASFLIGAPFIAFANRSLINQDGYLHTRANGAGVRLKTKLGAPEENRRVALDIHAWARDDGSPGNTWVARALYLHGGLMLHAALQEHVHLPGRVLDENRQAALAAFWEHNGWTARGEALAVLDSAATDNLAGVPFVVHTEFLKAFAVNHMDREITVEPGFRYDISVRDVVRQRATAGVNVYFLGHQLKTQLNYDVQLVGTDVSHAVFATMQGGL